MVRWLDLIGCFALVYLIGTLGAAFSRRGSWYECVRSPLTPPPITFAVVWNVLYALIAIALYLELQVWRRSKNNARTLASFCVNLISNSAWTGIFFGLKMPGVALVDLAVVLMSAVALLSFAKDPRTKYLLLPYVAWLLFAAVLNYQAWRLDATKRCSRKK